MWNFFEELGRRRIFRTPAIALLAVYVTWLIASYRYHFIDRVNLPVQEAGHVVLAPFGQTRSILHDWRWLVRRAGILDRTEGLGIALRAIASLAAIVAVWTAARSVGPGASRSPGSDGGADAT